MNFKKILSVAVVLLSLGIVISSCSKSGNSLDAKKAELTKLKSELSTLQGKIDALEQEIAMKGGAKEEDHVHVSAMEIKLDTFRRFLDINGVVESSKLASISSKMGGLLQRLYVNEGSYVKKGQVIAEFESDVLNKTLTELQGSYDFVVKIYNKQANLWEQKAISEIQYLEAKNNKESLERKIETFKRQLQDAKLYAPFDGVIDRVYPKVGEMVGPGMPVAQLSGSGEIKVIANVSETYISTFKEGSPVKIYFSNFNKTVPSRVDVIAKSIDTKNRTFRVEMSKSGLPQEAKPNMLCSVKFNDVTIPNTFVIPLTSIQKSDAGDYVYVVEGNIAKKRIIKVGLVAGDEAQIIEGLNTNDKLITDGVLDVSDGQKVVIK